MQADAIYAGPIKRQRFLRHHDQVAAARRFVADALPRGCELGETARLLVSETVTSILDQAPAGPGRGSFEVAWGVVDDRLRIEVSDEGGPARLRHRIHQLQSDGGGGPKLLQILAYRWGVREGVGGQTIWFELDLAGSQPKRPR